MFPEDTHVAELPIHNRLMSGFKTTVCVYMCTHTDEHSHYGTECDSPAGRLSE